jgi:hypothetical protein
VADGDLLRVMQIIAWHNTGLHAAVAAAEAIAEPLTRARYLLYLSGDAQEDLASALLMRAADTIARQPEIAILDMHFGWIRRSEVHNAIVQELARRNPTGALDFALTDADQTPGLRIAVAAYLKEQNKSPIELANSLLARFQSAEEDSFAAHAVNWRRRRNILAILLEELSESSGRILLDALTDVNPDLASHLEIRWLAERQPERAVELALGALSQPDRFPPSRMDLAAALSGLASRDTQRAIQLWRQHLADNYDDAAEGSFAAIVTAYASSQPDVGRAFIETILPGDSTRYSRENALRDAAVKIAKQDLRRALGLWSEITDQSLSGTCLTEIIDARNSAHPDEADSDEIDELIKAIYILHGETEREDALEAVMLDANHLRWSRGNLSELIYRFALGNRSTFFRLLGLLVGLICTEHPDIMDVDGQARDVHDIMGTVSL